MLEFRNRLLDLQCAISKKHSILIGNNNRSLDFHKTLFYTTNKNNIFKFWIWKYYAKIKRIMLQLCKYSKHNVF